MAVQSISNIYFPSPPFGISGQPSGTVHLLDAGGEKSASVFRIPKTGTVSKVHWGVGTVTTGATMDVRLETIDASGDPSGTLVGTNTNGSQVVSDTDDNANFTTALTAGASVTKGDEIAVVIVNPAVSPGNLSVQGWADEGLAFPYRDHFTTSWSKASTVGGAAMALEYDDGSYAPIAGSFPCRGVDTAYNSGSTPDEIGIRFSLAVPVRVGGFWVWSDLDAAADMKLYDSDGSTVLASTSLDSTRRQGTVYQAMLYTISSSVQLSADTVYRLTLLPTSVTDIRIGEFTVGAAAVMDAFSGGQSIHRTERTNAGAWTETTTQRPFMGLIIDGLEIGGPDGRQMLSCI